MASSYWRLVSVAILTFGLGGCLDLSSRTVVNPDGSMTVSSDVGIDKAVATQLGKMSGAGKPQSDGSGDFAQMCQQGFDSAFKEMQSTLGGARQE